MKSLRFLFTLSVVLFAIGAAFVIADDLPSNTSSEANYHYLGLATPRDGFGATCSTDYASDYPYRGVFRSSAGNRANSANWDTCYGSARNDLVNHFQPDPSVEVILRYGVVSGDTDSSDIVLFAECFDNFGNLLDSIRVDTLDAAGGSIYIPFQEKPSPHYNLFLQGDVADTIALPAMGLVARDKVLKYYTR